MRRFGRTGIVLGTLVVILVGLSTQALAVSLFINATPEPLGPNAQTETIHATWQQSGGVAYITYGDGAYSQIWTTANGDKTVNHTYPCVDGQVNRVPTLNTSNGFVTDPFVQMDSNTNTHCPP
jgi:hypothetical protein